MTYFSGFLLAVPAANKEKYRQMAHAGWEVFKDCGAVAMRENWGIDVPDGKVTSFPMAVKKKDDEVVVFSWIEWPDKATADAAWEPMMKDPRMDALREMPFDGMRMMWGGFEELVNLRA